MRRPAMLASPEYANSSGTASESRQRPKSKRWISSNRASRSAGRHREALFLDDVQADEAEVADVLLHEVGDVVVAHEQHVERHVLAVAHQLVLAAAVLEAAADQQVERVIGQPAGLLDGDAQSLASFHGHRSARRLAARA